MLAHVLNRWEIDSWQLYHATQQPKYEKNITRVLEKISSLPGLVNITQINKLQTELNNINLNNGFLLQIGDCAETFDMCNPIIIQKKLQLIYDMGNIIQKAVCSPITYIGRIAGQYSKPRSSDYEHCNGITLPAYRGDLVNKYVFKKDARAPKPHLLIAGYKYAQRTIKHIDNITTSLFKSQTIYTSHEALHLPFEQSMTKFSFDSNKYYNLSTHFPWIGMRSVENSPAHIEFIRGISNPIAVKIGPNIDLNMFTKIIDVLNPQNKLGRLTIIYRLGCKNISKILPKLLHQTIKQKRNVLWLCDPMHGNTEVTKSGIKTRRIHNILNEIYQAINIHNMLNTKLSGIHLETYPMDVTECIDDELIKNEKDLKENYMTHVDPRLNYRQALMVADFIAKYYIA